MAQCKISKQTTRARPCRNFRCSFGYFKFLFLVSLSGVLLASLPSLAQQPSQAEVETIQQLMIRLKSSDKRQSSGAAQALGSYTYIEVNQALIQAATQELAQANPNTFVIGNAVKSLKSLSTPQDIPALRTIKSQIDQLVAQGTANRAFPHIAAEVDQAIQAAGQRRDADLQKLIRPTEVRAIAQGALGDKPLLKQELTNLLTSGQRPDVEEAAKIALLATSSFLSDDILEQLRKNEQFEIFGRDKETEQAIDTLTREKGKNPILVGPRGAGKTTIVEKIARTILEGNLPAHAVYQNELANAFVIETTPARISRLAKANDNNSQAAALEMYFDAVLTLESKLGVKIVLFVDEIHTFGPGQVEAMKPYLDSRTRAIKLIGASTSVEYQNAFKNNPAIQRRFDPIGVSEQSVEEVRKIIMASEKPRTEKRYGFRVTDEAIDVIVNNANRVYPDTSLVDASAKMLMTLASVEARKLGNRQKSVEITEGMVYEFIQNKLGYPVNPLDVRALQKYKEDLLKTLNEEVIGQERMVGDVTDEWIRLLKNNRKGVRSVLALGPTGVGKSHLGRELAKKVFGSEGAFLEVDANQFKEGSLSTNTFFGAPNGVLSSDKTAGMLFDYLDDPGKGKFGGVILINEAERAHTDFWEKMMEIMDTGRATGGDGKERILSRHLIVLTSNRGDLALYPRTIEDWTESEYKAHMDTLTEERLKAVFKEATTGRDQFRLPDPILARIDKYTAAEPMVPAKIRLIAIQKAQKVIRQIETNFKIKIELDPTVPAEIAKASYQKGLGARPVEKKVVDLVEAAIDRYLASNDTNRGDQLRVSLVQSGQTASINVQGPRGTTTLPIPITVKQDLLSDQELLARLDGLDKELKSRIFGQDEMISRIKDAVIAHQATQGKRPLSIFAVGTTGTGKTETAKALAKSLYRSETRVIVLDMGKIIYEGEFNNIFGSPAGHVGSQEERIFEQFLRENPQGGVIVFDEISNMGGKDPAQKQALFKKLYSIFEEGVWTSPATNKTYELSKYTVLNTGNDLEGLLQGLSADDLRLSVWNKNKSPANVRAMLLKAGVPEAFLGRMADIILMKPLLKAEVNQVTRKILTEQTREFKEKGVDIKFEESFVQDISNKFFTQDQGARSIRNLVEFRVKSAITQLIIKAKGIQNLQGKTIYLSIEDNQVDRTYIRPSDPERKVTLKAALKGKDAMSVMLDATEFASKVNLQTRREVLRTSYHEAGHAIVNDPAITGERVAIITVIGQDNYLGYARYEEISGRAQSPTEQKIIVEIAKLLAGQTAERLAGFQPSAGWANDLEKARSLATKYILDWGLGENMASVQVDEKGKPKLSGPKARQFQKEMDRIFSEAQTLSENVLRAKWSFVRAVVGELYAKGQITGDRFTQIESQLKQTPGLTPWVKREGSDRLVRPRGGANRCADLLSGRL